MTSTLRKSTLDEVAAKKLPHEAEHLDALTRMRAMAPYYEWVASLFAPWLGTRILDAGCGVGNFEEQIVDRVDLALGIDLSRSNIEVAKDRFSNSPHISFEQVDLDQAVPRLERRGFDTVVCLDVLEHIQDDAVLMRHLANVVRPGGHVLVKVPACPWLFGSIDVASDHYRRYSPRMLRMLARETGLEVLYLSYMNIAGVAPYLFKSRILRRDANFSRTFSEKQLTMIARTIPWLRRLDTLTGPPVGQSLVMAAVKPTTG